MTELSDLHSLIEKVIAKTELNFDFSREERIGYITACLMLQAKSYLTSYDILKEVREVIK